MRSGTGARRLLAKMGLFALPFIVLLAIPAVLMTIAGEFRSVDRIIDLQSSIRSPILFGRAYSDPTANYKLESSRRRHVDVMALGTSRVLAFRSEFFRDSVAFFNAGNGITKLAHLRPFLRKLPADHTPKVIILGLDQYFLNPKFESLQPDDMEDLWSSDFAATDVFFSNWIRFYSDLAANKIDVRTLADQTARNRYGINARMHENAFRNDGSYQWGLHITDPDKANLDKGFANTFDRIAKGDRRFEHATHVADANLLELQRFLADCHARGIHVVGFLPPFAHVVYERMQSMPVEYGYLQEVPERARPLFEQFGYMLFDFSDLASTGASDSETIDGFHGTEKAYLRLFLKMAEADPGLRSFARDLPDLQARLADTKGDHLVFGYQN